MNKKQIVKEIFNKVKSNSKLSFGIYTEKGTKRLLKLAVEKTWKEAEKEIKPILKNLKIMQDMANKTNIKTIIEKDKEIKGLKEQNDDYLKILKKVNQNELKKDKKLKSKKLKIKLIKKAKELGLINICKLPENFGEVIVNNKREQTDVTDKWEELTLWVNEQQEVKIKLDLSKVIKQDKEVLDKVEKIIEKFFLDRIDVLNNLEYMAKTEKEQAKWLNRERELSVDLEQLKKKLKEIRGLKS